MSSQIDSDSDSCVDMTWRRLALQFDGHRMQALWHLKALLNDPQGHKESVEAFLAAAPLSGEEVLASRIKALKSLSDPT